jgi:hypothetical protein
MEGKVVVIVDVILFGTGKGEALEIHSGIPAGGIIFLITDSLNSSE